jgi:G3E family GTPase
VIITKAEKLHEESRIEIKGNLRKVNPFAVIHFTEHGNVKSFAPDKMSEKRQYFPVQKAESRHAGIQSRTIHFQELLNRNQFTHWLSYTLDVYKNEIYRVKGFVCFDNEPYEYILQCVGGNFELTEGDKLISVSKSTLVFLGKLENVNLSYYE